jgi:hypothetical protein
VERKETSFLCDLFIRKGGKDIMVIAQQKKRVDNFRSDQGSSAGTAVGQGGAVYNIRYLSRCEVHNVAYYRVKDVPVVVRTKIKNMSPNGVCLYVSSDVRTGERLKLKIYLFENDNIEAEGVVIWKRHDSGHRYDAGVMFDQLPQKRQDQVLEYILGQNKSPREP